MLLTYFKSKLCAEYWHYNREEDDGGGDKQRKVTMGGWEGMSELELHSIAHEMAQTVAGLAEQALSY